MKIWIGILLLWNMAITIVVVIETDLSYASDVKIAKHIVAAHKHHNEKHHEHD